ncbi:MULTISPECIES: TerD family protein [unclassified Streptomyces]|uniref:TerD family protein n=1 Tax=unclassified Streptomyces TaxID=2593676 RepID=UPI00278BEB6C|nr:MULTISPECIES: TerD family protein [unclassified Streptomyces]
MSSVTTGLQKIEVKLRWDPSPLGQPPHHLDIVAATYSSDATDGQPRYVVHYDSRSPDGTINMSRHSETGMGLGFVEVMALELDRLAPSYARVVVGVVIHQDHGPRTFGDIENAEAVVVETYTDLMRTDFAPVAGSTSATVVEFVRNVHGAWELHEVVSGFDCDTAAFPAEMGHARSS